MIERIDWAGGLARFLSRWMLALLVASYALASILPGPGLWIKDSRFLDHAAAGLGFHPTLPKLMLSFLLLNAGLHVRVSRMAELARRPGTMIAGLAANLAVPLAFIGVLLATSGLWHNSEEFSELLIGLTLVAAMPIAGSSTGWTRAADGDMTLSLGLVMFSTLLSPLLTPMILDAVGLVAPHHYGDDLVRLADHGTGRFLMVWVMVPSVLGMVGRLALGGARVGRCEKGLKPLATVTLLILCYANSASCLPQALGRPDWDFLILVAGVVTALCVATFWAGYELGRALGLDHAGRSALMFGLGMNNNGTGLVLVASTFGGKPMILLPVLAYNLAQHLVAGCANALHRPDQDAGLTL